MFTTTNAAAIGWEGKVTVDEAIAKHIKEAEESLEGSMTALEEPLSRVQLYEAVKHAIDAVKLLAERVT